MRIKHKVSLLSISRRVLKKVKCVHTKLNLKFEKTNYYPVTYILTVDGEDLGVEVSFEYIDNLIGIPSDVTKRYEYAIDHMYYESLHAISKWKMK